jgi:hypothetical protein
VTDVDPALKEKIFYVMQRQRKSDVHQADQSDYIERRMEVVKRERELAILSAYRPGS